MLRRKSSLKKRNSLDFIKLSYAALTAILLLALPFITSSIKNRNTEFKTESSANDSTIPAGPVQSWIISPNGREIVYGNTEIQFFAKDALNAQTRFKFELDLVNTSNNYSQRLFTVEADQELANRDGIRSKFVDLTGLTEASTYKLKLTTTVPGTNTVITDYSDNNFTISPNNSKPIFRSYPSNTNLSVGQQFNYDISIGGTTNYKLVGATIPQGLTLNGNKLNGAISTEGVFSVVLVAINDAGRQSSQVFSLNVTKPNSSTTSSPTRIPTITPTLTDGKNTPNNTVRLVDQIIISLPQGDKITKVNSKIESKIPDAIKAMIKNIVVEISRDGENWQKVYEGTDTSFNLDTSKFEGGEYFLRFIYEFNDGKKEIKNYEKVQIIKQNEDPQTTQINIKNLTPNDGQVVTDRTPSISAAFEKPAGTVVDTKTFKLEIDGKGIENTQDLLLTEFSFSYLPNKDLDIGKHKIRVEIALENEKPTVKEWSFEITDQDSQQAAQTTKSNGINRNRVLIIAAACIILLIIILSIWAISLARKEEKYHHEVYTPVDDSPLVRKEDSF